MRVSTRRLLTLLMLMLLTGVIPANAQTASTTTTARDAVLAYYNAINLRDYQTAYNMRRSLPQTYQQFSSGFADTVRGVPYIGLEQPADNGAQYVPLVLIAYRTNGTIASYYGCFTLSSASAGGLTTWTITRTRLRVILGGGYPDTATIINYLNVQCATMTLPVFTASFVDLSPSLIGHSTLYTYYDLINGRNYAAAYALWLAPISSPPPPNGAPAQDFRPNATTFAGGYANTRYVTMYLGRYNQTGASAGRAYLDGLQPVVLIGTSTSGTSITYSGCYVIGRFAGSGTLGIVNGRLSVLARGIADPATILNALNTDCTALAIPL